MARVKSTMSVPEMRTLLGLRKTESYWLLKKGYFETVRINNRLRIVRSSFEAWYKQQCHYHKITGEEPGSSITAGTYSVDDIAKMFAISTSSVYGLIASKAFPIKRINNILRVPKEPFDQWYSSQEHYRTKEQRDNDRIIESKSYRPIDIERMYGIDSRQVYYIAKKNPQLIKTVQIAGSTRIMKSGFKEWLQQQESLPVSTNRTKEIEKPLQETNILTNKAYLSIAEAATIMQLTEKDVYRLVITDQIPAMKLRNTLRINRTDIEHWITEHIQRKDV